MIAVHLNMLRIIERHDILVFAGKQLPGAAVAAVNDTLIELREKAVASLSNIVNAPREEVDDRVLIEPAIRESRIAASGNVFISRKLIPLKRFGPQQTATGVTYSPISGKTVNVKRAFGPDISRLGKGVWKRAGKSRLPIEKVPGFSMARSKQVAAVMTKVGSQTEEILLRNIDFYVGQFLTNLTSGKTTFGPTYITRNRGATIAFGRRQSIVTATTSTRRR